MNVLITGGRGFIGSTLGRELRTAGHDVVITTRQGSDSSGELTWKPPSLIPPKNISTFDAIVNLAGDSIYSDRWTKDKKERIRSSRINTTHYLIESIKNADIKPKILINASAVGYYGPLGDEEVTENFSLGKDFLASVCKDWESEALKAEELGVRTVITRFGVVLGQDGGALQKMITPFKAYAGGYLGSGKQWMSWVHIDDVTGFIMFAIEHDKLSGVFNLTAPNPSTNKDFSTALGRALGRPSIFPVPGFVLKAALGEFGEILLTGQRCIPERALIAGYEFKYPLLDKALKSIV
jgi:hypothetical protein